FGEITGQLERTQKYSLPVGLKAVLFDIGFPNNLNAEVLEMSRQCNSSLANVRQQPTQVAPMFISLAKLISGLVILTYTHASPVPEPTTPTHNITFPDLLPRQECRDLIYHIGSRTCNSIATQYNITVSELGSLIRYTVSPVICIPPEWRPPVEYTGPPEIPPCNSTYSSVAGDTCRSIGLPLGLLDYQIWAANRLIDCHNIPEGTSICIPPIPFPSRATPLCPFNVWVNPPDTCDQIGIMLGPNYAVGGQAIRDANPWVTCDDIPPLLAALIWLLPQHLSPPLMSRHKVSPGSRFCMDDAEVSSTALVSL
ncbi:4894_t:CDS:2, partial [Acaulospora colombiana]